jgi:hypothetical protein
MPPWAWFILIPIAFALWWCVLLTVTSYFFGWTTLARHYRATEPFAG